MEYECAIAGGGEWLCVRVRGDITLADGKHITEAAHAALCEHTCRKALMDLRETAVRLSLLDLYELGEFAETRGRRTR